MLSERIDLRYRLHFRSAFHFGTGLRAGLVHRAIARRRDGMPFVPGSTLKGVLRDQATQIAHLLGAAARPPHALGEEDVGEFAKDGDVVAGIFGSRVLAGTISFDDALLCAEDEALLRIGDDGRERLVLSPTETRTQVSMSRRLGTARRGLLFTSEYGLGGLRFDGRIVGVLRGVPLLSDPTRSYELTLLLAALKSLARIGGNSSAGAGQVTCVIEALSVNGGELSEEAVDSALGGLADMELYQLSYGDEGEAS